MIENDKRLFKYLLSRNCTNYIKNKQVILKYLISSHFILVVESALESLELFRELFPTWIDDNHLLVGVDKNLRVPFNITFQHVADRL